MTLINVYSTDRKDENKHYYEETLPQVKCYYIQARDSSPNKESLESVTGGRVYCPARSSPSDRQ